MYKKTRFSSFFNFDFIPEASHWVFARIFYNLFHITRCQLCFHDSVNIHAAINSVKLIPLSSNHIYCNDMTCDRCISTHVLQHLHRN